MHLLGVELWCCRCNRYLIIDTIISVVVAAVCVPVFITVSAARAYTGILLGAAVIVLCRLWRFLPSHKRWVDQQACKMAAKLVAERRIVRPPTQLPWLPPEDPSNGRKDAVASPLYYPCATPSSAPSCNYYCGAPVSGYDQQVDDHTMLDRNGSPAFSHRVSMASLTSSGRHSSVAAIAGEGDARVDLMHSLPAPPVPLALQGASYASLEVKSLAANASRSRQGSHYLRSGASPSSVFLS
ncbi:putative integral membrane protein [Leishmania donovani]|uniref:Putative integral membrane protein n=1 Tax=Leishmania donovani TaxID=5661 RepID=A0A504XRE3_LEIDO|nr:putative integral membrane protein [Leishmania donovani]